MIQINILKWSDTKITFLKENNIEFNKGIPQLPNEFIFKKKPVAMSTYAYRKDIGENEKKDSLINFYMYENRLWPRLNKIDEEIPILLEYGGIVGFDLSPSVKMKI